MIKGRREDRSLVAARLELSSRNGELQGAALTLGNSSADFISVPTRLPAGIQEKCLSWYRHLELKWEIRGDDGIKSWRRKNSELASEIKNVMRAALLPDEVAQLIKREMELNRNTLFLLGIYVDNDELDYMPVELLGQPDGDTEAQMVVWRCRAAPVQRKPVLRLLVARSAPSDVSLPQNEDEVSAIRGYIAAREGPGIKATILGNSTYEEFTLTTHDFNPGVIHLATHGTRTAFQFNSPPSHDPMEYSSFARYIGRRSSVTTVVSTACFSAQPSFPGESRGICFASEVIELGVSAAIGMATKITPNAAQKFTEALYTELANARSIVEAYAAAVLAVRDMREDDNLLWSVPVMYAKSSNVIPFPNRGYFELLDRLEGLLVGFEDLRSQLTRLPMIPRKDRIADASGLALDMAAIRQELSALEQTVILRDPNTVDWPERFHTASRRIDWLMPHVAGAVRQGQAAEQMSSMLTATLNEIEKLVTDEFPIAGVR
jgi:hypothetical protein